MKKGLFIAFEGPEGVGKSTILNMVYDELKARGKHCISTREPGGIVISEKIRDVILDKKNTAMDGKTEALLYAAARRQHLVEKVIPALNEGTIVLCDRFVFSSLAYQGYARGLGIDEVMAINEFAIDGYMPDITLYLDIDPKEGLNRIKMNKDREVNRLDLESLKFHEMVREGYKLIIDKYKCNVIEIDGGKSVKEVYSKTMEALEEILN